MRTPQNDARHGGRGSGIGRGIVAGIYGLVVAPGYVAFGYSFHSRPGQKPDDAFFAVVLFAGAGACLAVVGLVVAVVPLTLRWWRRRWALPAVALLALCTLRIVTATYTM